MKNIVLSITILLSTWLSPINKTQIPGENLAAVVSKTQIEQRLLARQTLSLKNRHTNQQINEVFAKNILLNLAYISGEVKNKEKLDWQKVTQAHEFSIVLHPNQVFGYHDHVLPEYEQKLIETPKTYFHAQDGYLSSGYLYGDGVCHLASLLNWTALSAGLETFVPKSHSIAKIPDIDDEYGVSIYVVESDKKSGVNNNLYITNTKQTPIEFKFIYNQERVAIEVYEQVTLA